MRQQLTVSDVITTLTTPLPCPALTYDFSRVLLKEVGRESFEFFYLICCGGFPIPTHPHMKDVGAFYQKFSGNSCNFYITRTLLIYQQYSLPTL